MNGREPSPQELIQLHLDGVLNEAQHRRLNRLLGESPALLREFVEAARLDAHVEYFVRAHDDAAALTGRPWLEKWSLAAPGCVPPHVTHQNTQPRAAGLHFKRRLLVLLPAAVIVLAIGGLMGLRLMMPGARVSPRPDPVAVLTGVQDAVWEPGSLAAGLSVGEPLVPGVLKLRSGRVTVEFDSGAAVAVRGPAEFGINSADRAWLGRGRLGAVVPASAKGFTIGAPGLAVVDLGTRFGLTVGADRLARVEVLEGHVKVRVPGRADVDLRTHEAAKLNGKTGAMGRVAFDGSGVPRVRVNGAMGGYVPGYVWVRRYDFSREGRKSEPRSPVPDRVGRAVWTPGWVEAGPEGGGAGSDWYTGELHPLVWVEDWYGHGPRWAAGPRVGPLVNADRLSQSLSGASQGRSPVLRWSNPIAATVPIDLDGTLVVRWQGRSPEPAEVVIARVDDAGRATELLRRTVKPTGVDGVSPVPVELHGVTIRPGDGLLLGLRGSGTSGYVEVIDDLRLKLMAIPPAGR